MFQAAFRAPEILALIDEQRPLEVIVDHLGYNLQLASSVLSVRRPNVELETASTFAGRQLPKRAVPPRG